MLDAGRQFRVKSTGALKSSLELALKTASKKQFIFLLTNF